MYDKKCKKTTIFTDFAMQAWETYLRVKVIGITVSINSMQVHITFVSINMDAETDQLFSYTEFIWYTEFP